MTVKLQVDYKQAKGRVIFLEGGGKEGLAGVGGGDKRGYLRL